MARRLDRTFVQRVAHWQLALPAAVTVALAFMAGGFFAGTVGLTAGLLCLLLLARLTLAERPFAGWTPALAVTTGVLALFCVWTLASSGWSDAPVRALTEFNRALLYLLMLAFLGLHARGPGHLSVLLRWVALAITVTCAAALATRLLPATFPTKAGVNVSRLAFPLTYWNALGLFAGLGTILLTHLTASEREPAAVRVAAAAGLPIVAVTLYFTFSRGGIGAAIAGVVIYLVVAHPLGLIGALPAVGLPLAFALQRAYGAELLARDDFSGADAREQGRALFVIMIVCIVAAAALRALALLVDRRMAPVEVGRRARRAAYGATAAAALLALVVALVAFDVSDRFDRAYREFVAPEATGDSGDLRTRLTDLNNNGRLAQWRVALDAAHDHPWHGVGAGTFRLLWEQERPKPPTKVVDAHSLYYETRGELGWIGVLLLAVVLLVPLGVAVSRLGGPDRHIHAAFVAAGVTLLIHANVDWDWEMPALFIWFFSAGGVVLAAPADGTRSLPAPRRLTRLVAGLACLLLALTPVTVAYSQLRLNRSVLALERGDCATATEAALDSLDALSVQAEAFEVLGWCDARAGRPGLAVEAMRAARLRDPHNWQYAYGLAITQALAGEDPRASARLALRLNPLEPLARKLVRDMRTDSVERRRALAGRSTIPFG